MYSIYINCILNLQEYIEIEFSIFICRLVFVRLVLLVGIEDDDIELLDVKREDMDNRLLLGYMFVKMKKKLYLYFVLSCL